MRATASAAAACLALAAAQLPVAAAALRVAGSPVAPAAPLAGNTEDGASDTAPLLATDKVAQLLLDAERHWTEEGLEVVRTEKEDGFAEEFVMHSCVNVSTAIVQGAQGHKGHIISQLRKACAVQHRRDGGRTEDDVSAHEELCGSFAEGIATVLGSNPLANLNVRFSGFCKRLYKDAVLSAAQVLDAQEREAVKQANEARRAQAVKEANRKKSERISRTLKVLGDAVQQTEAQRAARKRARSEQKKDEEAGLVKQPTPEEAKRGRILDEREAEESGGVTALTRQLSEEDKEKGGIQAEAEEDAMMPLGGDQDDAVPPEPPAV